MNLLDRITYFVDKEADNKTVYTVNIAVIMGALGILIYIMMFLYYQLFSPIVDFTDVYRALFLPIISGISLVLLKLRIKGFAKLFFIMGAMFVFSFYPLIFGRMTKEILLLTPVFVILLSAITQFIFNYKKERLYYLLTLTVFILILLFFYELLEAYYYDSVFKQLANADFFVVRFLYILVFVIVNFIIHFSVKLNEKIQLNLDEKNQELDKSRSSLLNQNIQLKQIQNDVVNQNEELKAFTEELQTKNELVEAKNEQLNISYIYTKTIKNLLTNEVKVFHQHFKDFFIFDKPIAHVSSNLFWSRKVGNKLYFVLADANGDYSSSSIFSVLIIKLLNLISVEEPEVSDFVDKIFNNIDEIHQESSVRKIISSDLLNLTLCCLHTDTKELSAVTINQRLLVNRNSELTELKSKVINSPAGKMTYSVEKILLKPDDILYLFTNACSNQIGAGGQGKLTFTRFKKALQQATEFPLNIQKEKLENFMKDWRGDEKQTENMIFVAIKME